MARFTNRALPSDGGKTVLEKSFFVLTVADADRNRRYLPSALDLAKYRLKRKEWGLKKRTRYRRHMKPGDKVLIYLSGARDFSQHFIAEGIIASASQGNKGALVDSPNIQTSIFSEFKIGLTGIRFFPRPVCVRDLLEKFEFVSPHRRKMWRIYFQGGALRLPRKDFELVVRASIASS